MARSRTTPRSILALGSSTIRRSLIGSLALGVAIAVTVSNDPARAQSPAAQRGLTFVRVHCVQCHSIDRVSESPLKIAPPFRTLMEKLPAESLERRLSEGIVATHPTMPQFRLEPDQLNDVMAYLKSLGS
ncbi:MAG: cytochrome c [Hyphomicrobiales bacterium]|nr:cytochrome c [Hyphomicrobiales bacterium]